MIFRKAIIAYSKGFYEVRYFSSDDGYKRPVTMIRFRTFVAAHISAGVYRDFGVIKGSETELKNLSDNYFRSVFAEVQL